jgi:hypothetical protein
MPIAILLQQAVSSSVWYETPTGAAAIVALIGVLCAPFVNSWLQNRKVKTEHTGHLSDTSMTLNAQERKEIMDQMRANYESQLKFLKTRLGELEMRAGRAAIEVRVSEFEARQRAHSYGNECNRLQSQVYKLQLELTKNGHDVPDFTFKTYPEIMSGIDEKVILYKEDLEKELEHQLRTAREEMDDGTAA